MKSAVETVPVVGQYFDIGYEYFKFCASGGSRLLLNIGFITAVVEIRTIPIGEALAPLVAHPIMAVVGYLMTNYLVFNRQPQPEGSQHASRGLLWYGAMWSGKGVNYGLYLLMIWFTPVLFIPAIPYQLAWFIGAVAVSPYTFLVNRWFWKQDFKVTTWASRIPLVNGFYDRHLRGRLKPRPRDINSITVLTTRFENPDAEPHLRNAIRKTVTPEDDVIVVGGGYGFSTVLAAKFGATVTAYEASRQMYDRLTAVIGLNHVRQRVTVKHAIVGSAKKVYGDARQAELIHPMFLPDCDVLILDCEGAETEILDCYPHRPRTIVVETHGHLDSPTGAIKETIIERGYRIEAETTVDAKRDIKTLVARR